MYAFPFDCYLIECHAMSQQQASERLTRHLTRLLSRVCITEHQLKFTFLTLDKDVKFHHLWKDFFEINGIHHCLVTEIIPDVMSAIHVNKTDDNENELMMIYTLFSNWEKQLSHALETKSTWALIDSNSNHYDFDEILFREYGFKTTRDASYNLVVEWI